MSQINTLLVLSAKELGHKGGQRKVTEVCIVCPAVGKKARLRIK